MEAAIEAAGAKALRLLFVFAASVPERVAETGLTTESAALPVVKSIGLFDLFFLPEICTGGFVCLKHFLHDYIAPETIDDFGSLQIIICLIVCSKKASAEA
jgi:hypothetical protein